MTDASAFATEHPLSCVYRDAPREAWVCGHDDSVRLTNTVGNSDGMAFKQLGAEPIVWSLSVVAVALPFSSVFGVITT